MTAQTNSTTYSPLLGGGSAVGGAVGLTGAAYDGLTTITSCSIRRLVALKQRFQLLRRCWHGMILDLARPMHCQQGGSRPSILMHGATVPWQLEPLTASCWLAGRPIWALHGVLCRTCWLQRLPATMPRCKRNSLGSKVSLAYPQRVLLLRLPLNPGATVFGTAASAQGLPIFSLLTPLYLVPVPEPTTLALAGLGGLSLLLFRRQRK